MRTRRLWLATRAVVRDTVRSLHGHDLLLYAAGLTFYALVGLVPLLLVATKVASALLGAGHVRDVGRALAGYTGTSLGVDHAIVRLTDSGTRLSVGAVVAILLPASLYSEGFVRAFDRLTRRGRRHRQALRGRVLGPPLAATASVLLVAGLAAAGQLIGALGTGTGARLLGIYLAFLVAWGLASVLLLLLYRGWSVERPGPRALVLGSLSAGSFLAGMQLGFLLVLRSASGVGAAYGGSATLGAVAVVGFLLYLDHLVVLMAYGLTLRLDMRLRLTAAGDPASPSTEVAAVLLPEAEEVPLPVGPS